jgi:hypothetical protein
MSLPLLPFALELYFMHLLWQQHHCREGKRSFLTAPVLLQRFDDLIWLNCTGRGTQVKNLDIFSFSLGAQIGKVLNKWLL